MAALGRSGAGEAFSSLGDILFKYLGLRMESSEREKERAAREKEFQQQMGLSREQFELMKKTADEEKQARLRNEAGSFFKEQPSGILPADVVERAKTQFGEANLPPSVQKTGVPGTLPSRSTVGVRTAPDAMGPAGSSLGQRTEQDPGGVSYRRQPSRQEMTEDQRMQMMMKEFETNQADAPLRRDLLKNQAAFYDPKTQADRDKRIHEYAMQEIRTRLNAGDKDFVGDMKTLATFEKLLEGMDPSGEEYYGTKQGIDLLWKHIAKKYPEMNVPAPGADDFQGPKNNELADVPEPPGAGKSSSLLDFLGGSSGGSVRGPNPLSAMNGIRLPSRQEGGQAIMDILKRMGQFENMCPDGTFPMDGKCSPFSQR